MRDDRPGSPSDKRTTLRSSRRWTTIRGPCQGDGNGDVSRRRLPSTPAVEAFPQLVLELIGPPAAEVLVSKAH